MSREVIFTKDLVLDMGVCMCCSLNYFLLLIVMVGFSASAFGSSTAEGGLAAGLYVVGGLISRFFFGKYTELLGRKRMLVISISLSVVVSLAYFVVDSMMMLHLIRLVHGMIFGISSTCTADIAARLIPASRRGEGLGYYYLSVTFAMAIGPLIGMHYGALEDYTMVFTIGLAVYVLATVFSILMHVPEEDLTEEQKKEAKSFTFNNLVQPSAIPLGLTCMVFYFAYSGVLAFIIQYTQGSPVEEVSSLFYLAVAVGTLLSRMTAGRIFDEHGPNIVIIPAFLAFTAGIVIYALTADPGWFLFSGFLMGFSVSIVYSICQTIVVNESPAYRYGVTVATIGSVCDLGLGFGPYILGIILVSTGYIDMYLICAAVGLVSMAMYWAVHGHRSFMAKRSNGC